MHRVRTIGSAPALMVSHLFLRLKPLPGRGKSCCVIACPTTLGPTRLPARSGRKVCSAALRSHCSPKATQCLILSAAAGQQLMRHRS